MTRHIAISLFLVCCHASVVLADYFHAKQLLHHGEQAQAMSHFRELAMRGHIDSQYRLALLYRDLGNKASLEQAYAWILLAKNNGHILANSLFKDIRRGLASKRQAKQSYLTLRNSIGISALRQSLFPVFTEHIGVWPKSESLKIHTRLSTQVRTRLKRTYKQAWAIFIFDVDWLGRITLPQVIASFPDETVGTFLTPYVSEQRFSPNLESNDVLQQRNRVSQLVSVGYKTQIPDAHIQAVTSLADKGSADHQLALALLHQYGYLASKPSAWEPLLRSAINGQMDSQYHLARCLRLGQHCQQDTAKALKWLEFSAMTGLNHAQFQIALQERDEDRLSRLANNGYLPAIIAAIDQHRQKNTQMSRHFAYKLAMQASLLYPESLRLLSLAAKLANDLGQYQQATQLHTATEALATELRLPKQFMLKLQNDHD